MKAAAAAAALALLLSADQCGDPSRIPEPRPVPADPAPTGSARVIARINLACSWAGRRWFAITPTAGREYPTREVKWTVDGRDWWSGSGGWSQDYNLTPGDPAMIVCAPLPGQDAAVAGCHIVHHNKIVVGPKVVQSGPVTCGPYIVPR